jgi:predicted amidohydrolase YtcJ
MLAGLEHSLGLAKRLGVTSVHDIIGLDKLAAYETARRQGRLTVRATLHFEERDFLELLKNGARPGQGGPLLRIGGMKLYADGSFGARTAALTRPYADARGERGQLLHGDARLRDAVLNAEHGGFQLLIHAIGDRAARQVVSAFEKVLTGPTRLRHRIEHLELAGKAEIVKMRRLGLFASMQPNFVGEWGLPGGMMESRLGRARLRRADPFKRVLRSGVPLVFGSDCMPFNPLYGIHSAVNAPFPDQRLSVMEAIAAYTRNAAAASFEEGFKGTLSPGKAADMVVLSDDPFERPGKINNMRVEAMFFDGRLLAVKDRGAPLKPSGRS